MGSTANYGIPYPEPTAPVRDGAANMRAIAERVAALLLQSIAGFGFRCASSIVSLDGNGAAIIAFSPPFTQDITAGVGSITVAINGDALSGALIIGAHQPQQLRNSWTVLARLPGGAIPGTGPYRINWIAMGVVG